MSLQFDGLNISEMQYNGLNIVEAMYNGELVYSAGPAANYPKSDSWGPVNTSGTAGQYQHEILEDGMYKVSHIVRGTGNFRSLIAENETILKSTSSAGTTTATSEYTGGFETGSIVIFGTEVLGAAGTTLNLSGDWNIQQIPADQEISGSYIYQNIPQTTDAQNPNYLVLADYLVTESGDYKFRVADTTPSANFIIGMQLNGQTVDNVTVIPPAVLDKTLTLVAGDRVRLGAIAFVPSVYTYGGTWTITPL